MYIFFSFITFLIFLLVYRLISFKLKLVDIPDHRKIHKGKIPLIGGLIIYSNILLYSFFFENAYHINIILFTSSILIILGALDDSIELGVTFRLITQLMCCLIVIGSGLVIKNLGDYMYFPNIEIGILSVVFTVFCVMGLTNSFNFIDGIDGLCASLSLIAIITILLLSFSNGSYVNFKDFNFIVLICVSISLFIFFNITNFSKVFLGDSGSILLGFFVSWLLIYASQNEFEFIHPILTIWCVTLPTFDIISVITRRLVRGANPFKPDRTHVHHILLKLGFSHNFTLTVILILSIILNLIGCVIFYIFGPAPSVLTFILLLSIYVLFMFYLSNIIKSN